MPELPEVEVIRISLEKFIINKKIKKVTIFNRNLRYKINSKIKEVARSQFVVSIKRKSKYLLIELSNNFIILFHLGMTGKIFIIEKNKVYKTSFYYENSHLKKHNHLALEFYNSNKLIYNDVRKFGFIKLYKKDKIKKSSHLISLGPDALNKRFRSKYLFNKSKKVKKNIKNFLMDQKYISGIGNIYANEILHISSINPRKITSKLNYKTVSILNKNIKSVLKSSIRYGGSSIKDFSGISGKSGQYQQKFRVYNREGEKCKKTGCKGKVEKIYISNRSSFFCPKCQKY